MRQTDSYWIADAYLYTVRVAVTMAVTVIMTVLEEPQNLKYRERRTGDVGRNRIEYCGLGIELLKASDLSREKGFPGWFG